MPNNLPCVRKWSWSARKKLAIFSTGVYYTPVISKWSLNQESHFNLTPWFIGQLNCNRKYVHHSSRNDLFSFSYSLILFCLCLPDADCLIANKHDSDAKVLLADLFIQFLYSRYSRCNQNLRIAIDLFLLNEAKMCECSVVIPAWKENTTELLIKIIYMCKRLYSCGESTQ